MTKYIFRDKNGNIFAEYTSENIRKKETAPEDIRIKVTKMAIESAKLLGYVPRKEDLEKYGLIDLT